MNKRAISVTLEADNLVWLRGRALGSARSISETLDELIASARGGGVPGSVRSVVGTVSIAPEDPGLLGADAVVRSIVGESLAREASRRGSWARPRAASRRRRG